MEIIKQELELFEYELSKSLQISDNKLSSDMYNFVFRKSKRLRPKLILLFTKALNFEIDTKILKLACATELLHNSTLIHDDIIDNSFLRRGEQTLNKKFNESISVLAGDYLLSKAMLLLAQCNNIKLFEEFSQSMQLMCKGEINQFFEKNQIPSFVEYIEKSKFKTAELYKASLISICHLFNIKELKEIENFAINFGIAFQIKDDLLNILNTDISKPALSDLYNGIYTAPILFLNNDTDISLLKEKEIINKLNIDKKYILETQNLIAQYVEKAIENLSFIENNAYKKQIIALCNNLAIINKK